ncbi:uncharacterized protein [Argopecten irradians]|uniref:uncharacterized protein n=1 Tax=Argopecten irradians TaxID=31199 RepID=UPI003711133B
MDSASNEQKSLLLSTYLERRFTGPEEIIINHRKGILITEKLNEGGSVDSIFTGSFSEGCSQRGSDIDIMRIRKSVAVMYPDQRIPPHLTHKTILYMKEANCCPGYVHLEVGQLRQSLYKQFADSLVRVGNSLFISSDIYREEIVKTFKKMMGWKCESNGPSSTFKGQDVVDCFSCHIWPKEANEWVTRTRLYGWPQQSLVDKIVQGGCHLVPVGDKCSDDTFLQWRISFATAERSLVHSFSHLQVKVYTLLKYFLYQIKDTLKQTIGDDDILCSYFLKTTMFHAIENSSEMLWQDKNLFYCFWFCFNILMAWVKIGFCPNYFIPSNNLFQRKIHGIHQQILLDILGNYRQMKWMCLSVGNFYKPTIWEELCDITVLADLRPQWTVQESVMEYDKTLLAFLSMTTLSQFMFTNKSFNLLNESKSDFEEVLTYCFFMMKTRHIASTLISIELADEAASGNKARYQRIKKHTYLMAPDASMGTGALHLATLHFLTGNFSKCLELSRQVIILASWSSENFGIHQELKILYKHQFHRLCTLERLRKLYTNGIELHVNGMYLPHICLEVFDLGVLFIPPLPYVLFLVFLCCHKLGDNRRRDEALHHLIHVQHDKELEGETFWIVYTLVGICYQTLGDFQGAINAYWKGRFSEFNPVMRRIAIVCLCMYSYFTRQI